MKLLGSFLLMLGLMLSPAMAQTTTLVPPYTGGHINILDNGTGLNPADTFFFNWSQTTNAACPTRPNSVFQLGWNLGPGGGAEVTGQTAMGDGWEAHYCPNSGEEYNERHIYFVDEAGVQHRPFSILMRKNGGGWQYLQHFDTMTWFEHEKPDAFAQFSKGGFSYRTTDNMAGVPTYGFSLAATAANAIELSRVGGDAATLRFGSWAAIDAGGTPLSAGRITSTTTTGTSPFAVTSTTEVANLRAATATTALGFTVTNDTSTNAAMYPMWASASSGSVSPKVSTGFMFNPSLPGFGIGQAPAARAEGTIYKNQNTDTMMLVKNDNTGSGAAAAVRLNNGSYDASFYMMGSGNSIHPNGAMFYGSGPGGLTFNASNGANSIYLASNDVTRVNMNGNGEVLIGSTLTDQGNYLLQVNSQIWATNATISTSDLRVKNVVGPPNDRLLNVVASIPTIVYSRKDRPEDGQRAGYGAQDWQRAFLAAGYHDDGIVRTGPDGRLGLDEDAAQTLKIAALERSNAALLKRIEQLEHNAKH